MAKHTPRAPVHDGRVSEGEDRGCWIDPGTDERYPVAFWAYRRMREAEEKPLARHRTLGPELDRHLWRCWYRPPAPEMEVRLRVRPDTSPRIRRVVAEILRSIRRGQRADDAIRLVARRFGLRYSRARAHVSGCLSVERCPRPDLVSPSTTARSVLDTAPAHGM